LGMQSRSGSTDADKIATYVVNPDGTRQLEHFPADDLPVLLFRWNFPIAGILEGRDPSEASKKRVTISVPPEDPSAPTRIGDSVKNAGGMVQVGKFHPAPFFRMVAKIGYAYTAATIGTEYLLPEVADIILGKSDRFLHFIGGGIVFDGPALPVTPLHLVAANNRVYGDDVFKVALVQLFAQFGSPPLHVVVAKRQNN